ncbi:unnamed protein product [Lactuca virosa]|uniref:RSE1/DDB1/CPSF1 C-terminal domain-containing protein n=1 Tax=Lactuca virosa TaxID=75947 RepID=A0AAU9NAM4_9ASTR|nr:unnamed protein product [Lactuca virosa]
MVLDNQKNVQIFYYAPKVSESWKGQKLLSRAEFQVGAHVTKFLRLQMLPTSNSSPSDKTNRFALLFGTLDGSIGYLFVTFHSNGKAHRTGPDTIVDAELLCHYDMLPFELQLEIANLIGTTRSQIISNLNDLALGTSFL